ncbi:CsbD family protein [Streptomyces sp. NPDC001982]|uniref:CsbD family protein n=1 Tax=Streptomyces sp. NPDC001982 TaxID=3154405 RepID=UPI003324FC26
MADKGRQDKMKGKAKETTGKVTGDREMEIEGKLQQARGEAKKARAKAGERVQETGRSIKRGDS